MFHVSISFLLNQGLTDIVIYINMNEEERQQKKALIAVTNIAKYDNLDRPTGAWFSEVTHFAKDFYDGVMMLIS